MNAAQPGLREVLSRCDRVLSGALSIILATISAGIGSAWSVQSQLYQKQSVPTVERVVKYVDQPDAPVEISINAAPGDAARAQLLAQYQCLAEVMYYEARGEGPEGEKAVAEVVFHRIASRAGGGSICGVVYEGANRSACQFSFACDGSRDKPKEPRAWREAQSLAAGILAGSVTLDDETEGATSYHATYVRPVWSNTLIRTAQLGNHVFYRTAGGEALILHERAFRGSVW